jgi:hypothetical protein
VTDPRPDPEAWLCGQDGPGAIWAPLFAYRDTMPPRCVHDALALVELRRAGPGEPTVGAVLSSIRDAAVSGLIVRATP